MLLRRASRRPRKAAPQTIVEMLSNFFEFVFVSQPTIACSFSPHISHPLGFLTEQLVFGASWSGSNKEEETCLIDFDMCDQHEAIV